MKARTTLIAAALVLAALAMPAVAQNPDPQAPLASNFLFNYYTQPGASQVQAGMYPAPHYVPSDVGQTYYTYQPLLPHEHMYAHQRTYYNYYAPAGTFYQNPCNCGGGGALNKTTVIWQSGCSHQGPSPFNWNSVRNAQYRLASRRYGLGSSVSGLGGCASGNCGCGN